MGSQHLRPCSKEGGCGVSVSGGEVKMAMAAAAVEMAVLGNAVQELIWLGCKNFRSENFKLTESQIMTSTTNRKSSKDKD